MDLDQSAVPTQTAVLLAHETVVGQPSPPASFLAIIRLRRPCAVTTVVLVPAGEAAFEHALVHDSYGSTPHRPAKVELLFNVRFAPPAVTPTAARRTNKLQKVLLDYRPDAAIEGMSRHGSQAFALEMPLGVSTNLLIFRSPLPILTVLVYGRPTGPAFDPPPPLPEPDWMTYLRVRNEGGRDIRENSDGSRLGMAVGDARLPLVRSLALLSVDLANPEPQAREPAVALDGEGANIAGITIQDRLDEVLKTLLKSGMHLTAHLKHAAAQHKTEATGVVPMLVDGSDAARSTETDPKPTLRLALEHLVELIMFSWRSQIPLELPTTAPEVGLLAALLLLAAAADPIEAASARALTASVIWALFAHETARSTMTAAFGAAVRQLSIETEAVTATTTGTIWDLNLWASMLGTEPPTNSLLGADRASFATLVHSLATSATTPALRSPVSSPPTPAALFTYLVATIQISAVAAVLERGRDAAGSVLLQTGQITEEEKEGLRLALGALRLWSVDPESAALCRVALIHPSTFVALCCLTACSDSDVSATAAALIDVVLTDAASSFGLSAAISSLPTHISESLVCQTSPRSRAHIEIARLSAYPAHILPTLRSLAESALSAELDLDGIFRLELWLHHLSRAERQVTDLGSASAIASTLLKVEDWIERAQRTLLGQESSYARDRRIHVDRCGTLISLARLSAFVLALLGSVMHTARTQHDSSSERVLLHAYIRQATACAARAVGFAWYCGNPAFLDAFCPSSLRPALNAAIEDQTLAARRLVDSSAPGDHEEGSPTIFDSLLEGLLDAACSDPAFVAAPAASLILSVWPRVCREDFSYVPRAYKMAQAAHRQKDGLDQLSLFLGADLRAKLDAARDDLCLQRLPGTSRPTISAALSVLDAIDRQASASASAADPLVISSHDLLYWLHTPSASSGIANGATKNRLASASPHKRTFALFDSPPTTKTYSKQEFRAPRTIVGANGLVQLGNISRAPSKHVDAFESDQMLTLATTAPPELPGPIFRKNV